MIIDETHSIGNAIEKRLWATRGSRKVAKRKNEEYNTLGSFHRCSRQRAEPFWPWTSCYQILSDRKTILYKWGEFSLCFIHFYFPGESRVAVIWKIWREKDGYSWFFSVDVFILINWCYYWFEERLRMHRVGTDKRRYGKMDLEDEMRIIDLFVEWMNDNEMCDCIMYYLRYCWWINGVRIVKWEVNMKNRILCMNKDILWWLWCFMMLS